MYSSREIELAKLSLYSYDYAIDNRTGIPDGWTLIKVSNTPNTGFQAYAFLNSATQEIVVSFAGTRFGSSGLIDQVTKTEPDWRTNINGALGALPVEQFGQAVQFFEELMADTNLSVAARQDVTFTGHSLGGGLASFMGVTFGLPALGFAPAPFQQMAINPAAITLLEQLIIPGLPHSDRFQLLARIASNGGDALAAEIGVREGFVRAISITGEAVTYYQLNGSVLIECY